MRRLLSGLWSLLRFIWRWCWGALVLGLVVGAFYLGVQSEGGFAFTQEQAAAPPPPAEAGPSVKAPELTLPNAAVARAGIRTGRVIRAPAVHEVRMVGMLEVDETRLEHITAWTNGRVEAQPVSITGEQVTAGSTLVALYSPELLRAHQELLEGKAAVRALDASASEFMRERAHARLEGGREKLRQLGLSEAGIARLEAASSAQEVFEIPSQMGGTVLEVLVRSGDHVKTGQRMYMVADLSELWLQLTAYESDLSWLRYGQTVRFEVESFPGRSFTGTIAFIHPVVDEQSRSVPVRVNVHNAELELYPGMFARATALAQVDAEGEVIAPNYSGRWICPMHPEVVADSPSTCQRCGMALLSAEDLGYSSAKDSLPPLLVPAGAVLTEKQVGVVYLAAADSLQTTFRGRRVQLGPQVGDHYLVYSGLEVGDEVVVAGTFKVDSELQIRGLPSMMNLPYAAVPRRFQVDMATLEALRPVFAAYLDLHAALAVDDLATARQTCAELEMAVQEAALTGLGEEAAQRWLELRTRLLAGAREGRSASTLDRARELFTDGSSAMVELEARFGHPEPWLLHQVYCPMVGASWLQDTPTIENPYLGTRMPRCGEPAAEHPPRLPQAARTELPAATRQTVGELLRLYLEVSGGLAHDDLDTARDAASRLAEAWRAARADGLSGDGLARWRALVDWNAESASEIGGSQDIQEARQWLVVLTRATLLAAELGYAAESELGIYACPMAFKNRGAIWIQTKGPVENPYFGAVMFDCGSFEKVLRPR